MPMSPCRLGSRALRLRSLGLDGVRLGASEGSTDALFIWGGGGGSKFLQSWNKNNPPISLSIYAIIIRRPASALLDKLLCPPGPGGPAAAG